ncbi:relaxin-3-like [Salvelinus namaycush]|uniref:Relaxin-3-like n=1 Tax=Salvelinus namaycush TaxID=8040 RepID=A0A8U0P9B5_SALNM|nr:relaxin-3 [Salvelinus alpinus]XP_038820266.1 relaxin-3-like [Salvelinus namaycush]
MKSQLFSLLLLCVLCVGEVRMEDAATVSAVRLCGREFLRAVVYTCGGSRWRRFPVEDINGRVDQNGLKPWGAEPVMDRRRRDLNEALTTVCCQLGCRKSDLTIMC